MIILYLQLCNKPVGHCDGWTVTVLYVYKKGYGTVDMQWSIAELRLLVAADISMELMECGEVKQRS